MRLLFLTRVTGEAGVEVRLGLAAALYVVDDETHEVFVTVRDFCLLDWVGRVFARPGRLPGRAVTVEARAGSGDPIP